MKGRQMTATKRRLAVLVFAVALALAAVWFTYTPSQAQEQVVAHDCRIGGFWTRLACNYDHYLDNQRYDHSWPEPKVKMWWEYV
jgi:hypothetical protein